ncbi:translation initiation factor IF-2 [Mariprofundus sp. NF]|uniref:translation initiation factor IF-2 n=1 Tax=Mariprofundus sp. NF TaxID=2608716 RepID=UPI0015A2B931|nr:translation initiation factor IF-2 [Mariprofundus sp. NF]NWF39304.1 translation initiation factor IF-2 [Mariprofundus sp. NF]
MAKRILDLAKELNVEASDIQRVAVQCNIVVSGPTSTLDADDQAKVRSAMKKAAQPDAQKSGGKTLTLNRPMVAGQSRSGAQVEGRGRTVEVAVRRRHTPVAKPGAVAKPAPEAAPAPAVESKPLAPAQRAAAAVEQKKLDDIKEKAAAAAAKRAEVKVEVKKPVIAKPAAAAPVSAVKRTGPTPAQRAAAAVAPASAVKRTGPTPAQRAAAATKTATPAVNRPQGRPGERPQARPGDRPQGQRPQGRPGDRPQGQRPQGRPGDRPQGQRPQNRPGTQPNQSTHKGPRTTIRRGLTPAQIAASKAPSSSVKQIEKKISDDRAQQRRSAPQNRPDRNATPAQQAATRRSPSVAVSPDAATTPPPGAQRRRGGPGGSRPQRRLSPAEKAARRDYASKRHEVLTPEQQDRQARLARGSKRRDLGVNKDDEAFVVRTVEVTDPIMVSELASRMAFKSAQVVRKLFEMGMTTTINEAIDAETAVLIVEEFGHKAKIINAGAVEDVLVEDTSEDNDEDLVPRPPVVVVMGHVDHGKTSILDALRKAHVADGEAGGITQHIGAYMVKLESGERVVFVDTPGHEAFTGLRARGASMTDVAVLVVAADDGVMPQTVEALNHARAAGVPIIVAVNKMDKEGADPEKVMRQLAEHNVLSEDWGGDTMFVQVSAHTGQGLDELLENLALQTEILELKANPERRGKGIVVESRLDRGRGPVATVLVQNGTFRQGDTVVVGSATGRLRAIVDENSVQHRTAGPSIPFELLGLDSVPEAGQQIFAVENEKQARDIVRYRKDKDREMGAEAKKRASLDELFADLQSGIKEVPVLIKGDVTGSVEAMAESLAKAGTDEVKVKVVHKGIGGITESDVMLASAANAIIIGFNVRPEAKAKKVAEVEGVDIRFYKIIYEAIDEIKAAMAGVLSPNKVEKVTGEAEVRDVFVSPKIGAVAGCYMTDGIVTRGARVRVLREGVMIYDGLLASLRRFKDDVKEVKSGYECGMSIEKFNDVKVGDRFEFYIIEEVAATL